MYFAALEHLSRKNEGEQYMEICKAFKNSDHEEYTQYVFGYLLPFLDELKSKNATKKGSKTIVVYGKYCSYLGELDNQGRANGHGVVVSDDKVGLYYEGTFVNDRFEGIGESFMK